MRNLSIRARLRVAFAVSVFAALLLIANGLDGIYHIEQRYSELADRQIPLILVIEDVELAAAKLVATTNEQMLVASLDIVEPEDTLDRNPIDADIEALRDELASYDRLRRPGGNDEALYETVRLTAEALIADATLIRDLIDQRAVESAFVQSRNAFEVRQANFLLAIDAAEAEEKDQLQASQEAVTAVVIEEVYYAVGIGTGAVILILVLGLFTNRSIIRPILALEKTTEAIAEGNLSLKADVVAKDEIGRLAESFNFMTDVLRFREIELREYAEELDERVKARTLELKDARDKALAAQRVATENSRLKSEFLSTMSHELRTPLNAIEGFTSIMLSGMGVELSPRAEDMTKRIAANSKRLLQLINDFLDLSRIESGRLELVNGPIQPARLANKWTQEIGILADEKGITLSTSIDPELPQTLLCDEDALSTIATNLLSNAIKFTKGGSVTLDLQRFEDGWAIVVADTGIGIPPHAREYIFEEFRQVDGSSKREYGGTGLGLALVQKLTRAMNGRVLLDSEVGKGSTFTVALPLSVPEESLEGVGNE